MKYYHFTQLLLLTNFPFLLQHHITLHVFFCDLTFRVSYVSHSIVIQITLIICKKGQNTLIGANNITL
jgi:hypothetical protein